MSSLLASRLPSPAPRESGIALSAPRCARFEAFGLSHRGLIRPGNEDSYAVCPGPSLFMVADGMGGAAAGEVAARMAVDAVRCAFENADVTWPGAMNDLPPPSPGLPQLAAALERANGRVYAAACADQTKAGMGTTLTALLLLQDRAAIAHVGDSRLYRLRGRRLEMLTDDHTLVEAYVRSGSITREEAKRSRYGHMITRAIGTGAQVEVDQRLVAVAPGDTFVLATDGLHGVVGDDEIAAILMVEPDLARAATQLVEAAFDAGAPDNVTVVLVRVACDQARGGHDA